MKRPHHPTPEAIELTEGEKDKIMNDFLLNRINGNIHSNTISNDLSTKTRHELTTYRFALSVAYERCQRDTAVCKALQEIYSMVEQAEKDLTFEGQQLPWK